MPLILGVAAVEVIVWATGITVLNRVLKRRIKQGITQAEAAIDHKKSEAQAQIREFAQRVSLAAEETFR